ncbi:Uncharacterized protein TCM_019900 [Theobroma cacao]|uniref:Uncharacterized protein n=1 Tax=Theobroma cacao TaxID=3641 RepID=A0A061EQZ1_THECC|nr:Uncharacterized protein TCM_019900 [Theobroma cacao]
MASTTLTTISSKFQHLHSPRVSFSSCWCFNRSLKFQYNRKILSHRVVTYVRKPISAFASDDNVISLKDARIVVESRDKNKIQQ